MRAARCRVLVFVAMLWVARGARAEVALSGTALFAGDDYGYRWDQYQLQLRHEASTFGEQLSARFHVYSLQEDLDGVRPFDGTEPAAELSGHLLADLWWFGAAVGFQGTADVEGLTGRATIARAFPAGSTTFTPRIELAREPLALTPLPLSLGLLSYRGEALLNLRGSGWVSEGGLRLDFWEADTIAERTQNPALDRIDPTRLSTLYGYVLSDGDDWFDFGFAAKVAWSSRNTLLATQVLPGWRYGWYPASAPPFAWETAAVLRARGEIVSRLDALLQLRIPLISRETREWDTLRASAWGTAPAEAKLALTWHLFSSTALHLEATIFAKPWADWDVIGDDAYRQAAAQVSLEQVF